MIEIINSSLIIILLGLFGWISRSNIILRKEIKDLKQKNLELNSRLESSLVEIKASIKEGSGSVLDAAKGHIETAMVAVSKRIGKRKSPKKDDSLD